MREVELVVVGGGAAGSAAARAAAELGVQTLLVDENPLDPAYLQRNVPKWNSPDKTRDTGAWAVEGVRAEPLG